MDTLISFQDALAESAHYSKRHLLLGNGFSIACVPTIFSYKSLYEEADFTDMPEVKEVFDKLNTRDFEVVIKVLDYASEILPIYKADTSSEIKLMKKHGVKLKDRLIETIAKNHPKFPSEIGDEKFNHCRNFLANFITTGGYVFYLNYDLLLYWTLMHFLDGKDKRLECNDGFGKEAEVEDGKIEVSNYLLWKGKNKKQNIHYLHGALHLFDAKGYLEKYSWVNTGEALLSQTKTALQEDKFPLFVSEGSTEKKLTRINHIPYLHESFTSFRDVANGGKFKPGNTCMFTYGFSFSDNDSHIIQKIEIGKIKHLYVSIYGDQNSDENKIIIGRVKQIQAVRKNNELKVTFYDASSAKVWEG